MGTRGFKRPFLLSSDSPARPVYEHFSCHMTHGEWGLRHAAMGLKSKLNVAHWAQAVIYRQVGGGGVGGSEEPAV